MKASKSPFREVDIVPTGIPELDALLEGGVSTRKITMFSGESGAGKSTICYNIVKNAQAMGMECTWADTEHRFQFGYSEQMGVDLDELNLEDIELAEPLFDSIQEWAEKNTRALLVLDSVGGLLTRKEAERSNEEVGYPDAPKLIPGFIRRIVPKLMQNNNALILINHEKKNFDGAIKILGGDAVKYHSDQWIRFRTIKTKQLKQGDEIVGEVVEASVWKGKNKKKTAELHLITGQGFSAQKGIIDEALDKGVLTKEGQSYVFQNEKIARGMKALREWIKENESAVKEAMK